MQRLRRVIDSETGVDVIRMRPIEDLQADDRTGRVSYMFRPSSPLCPLSVLLALDIREALVEVSAVTGQEIEVVGDVGADELDALLIESS